MSYDNNTPKGDEIELNSTPRDGHSGFDEAEEENEIDLLELAAKLWQQRKKIMIWCLVGAVLGVVVAFSIPKEYSTTVKLAPEIANGTKIGGSLGALASMAGIGGAAQAGTDAINPQLYPDIVSSIPFLVSLFNIPVEDIDGENKTTVREYVEEDLKSPWWSAVIGAPFKLLAALKSDDEEGEGDGKVNSFHLTKAEDKVIQTLSKRISASVDTKTFVITISVQMQDPMVSAVLADTVVYKLQEYITDYRTNKARHDLEYAERLDKEAKDNYYKAQQKYADYQDRNQGLVLHSAQTTLDRLENEATLAFNLYNQTSQQVQIAKAKVQENTPVYTIVTPASVPIKPTSPKKVMILIGFVFLAFVACAAWILYGQPMLAEMKQKKAEQEAENN